MNRNLIAALILATASLGSTSCRKVTGPPDPPPPPPPPPPAHYLMEARIDGAAWEAFVPEESGGDTLHAVAAYDPESNWLVMLGIRSTEPMVGRASMMVFVALTPLGPCTIPLGAADTTGGVLRAGAAGFADQVRENGWGTDEEHRGSLVIESVNLARRELRGRFEFAGRSEEDGSTIHVDRGVFICNLEVGAETGAMLARRQGVSSGAWRLATQVAGGWAPQARRQL